MMNVPIGACAMIIAGALLLPGKATANEFDAVLADVEGATHVHHVYIPMMSLVSGCAWMYTRGGVRGLHVADLENTGEKISQADFKKLMETRLSEGWTRMVMDQNFANDELTMIYTRPVGKRMEMMVASREHDEITLVNLKIDPKQLADFVNRQEHGHRF